MDRVPSLSALGTAATLQAAAVLYLSDLRLLALWVAAVSVSLFVWKWTHRKSKVFLVFFNALLLSLPTHGEGGSSRKITNPSTGNSGDGITADDTFPGVILFPDVQHHAILVPPLPAMKHLFSARSPNPLSIPFFGSYWVYKWPQRRLPKNAIVMRGDPDQRRFQSTDGYPLAMEAHQNLGTFIDVSCCSAIELAIRNADRYPGSVLVDLQLVDSHSPSRSPLSLGPLPVMSTQPWHPGYQHKMAETLSFRIPPSPSIPRFDEFTVRFQLDRARGNHSAGIAIERFVLVPR